MRDPCYTHLNLLDVITRVMQVMYILVDDDESLDITLQI